MSVANDKIQEVVAEEAALAADVVSMEDALKTVQATVATQQEQIKTLQAQIEAGGLPQDALTTLASLKSSMEDLDAGVKAALAPPAPGPTA